MSKISLIKNKKHVIYVKKSFVWIKMMKSIKIEESLKIIIFTIVTELFVRGRKLDISLVFITQSYFKVPKDVRLNTSHVFLQKFQVKENFNKLQQIIHQILALKISLISIENIQLNHILF